MSSLSQTNNINTESSIKDELPKMYDTAFSLIEEELYQRLHPETYKDSTYDGSDKSICMIDNRYINFNDTPDRDQKGGGRNTAYLPGKINIIRSSYQIPLKTAIEGSIERQKLFAQELNMGGLHSNHFC